MKQYKRKELPYECIIDVEYMPFPSEESKREAYYTHAKLFLRAKEREARDKYSKPVNIDSREQGGLAALSSYYIR
ncbi:MAG: hypothetical protein JW844_04735 [Candidatus Omnitrophica bacterium]|nr:hypothetical protein [Candidatus Omnitrophota bacterium]